MMGSNGALEASRTSSSMSSPAHHITGSHHEMNHYMSDNDNPEQIINEEETNNISDHDHQVAHLSKQDFLVSFLVDARGGAMKGCRFSGVKVIIPPKTAPQPMRITCRYIRENALLHPPELNEGEGLASRILQVGPRGSKFLGPVLIEVPHVASLRNGDREVVVLRCDSASKGKWAEHAQEKLDDKTLKELIDETVSAASTTTSSTTNSSPVPVKDGSRTASRLNHSSPLHNRSCSPAVGGQQPPPAVSDIPEQPRNVVHIVTKDFPQYFAIVSRPRQDIAAIGPEGAILTSCRVPKAQVYHKPKTLVKRVDVGLCALPVDDEMVEEIMVQGGSVSPIVTIEPRRRKFHKAITINMPLPERMSSQYLRRRQEVPSSKLQAANKQQKSTKTPIGANDLTVNPNKKPDPPKGILANVSEVTNSKEELDHESEIEMSLRLVCSMSANRSKAFWEDVTDTTPMTVVLNKHSTPMPADKYNLSQANVVQDSATAVDLRTSKPIRAIEDRSPGSVQFTSLVSASFWLVHCPNWMSSDVISLVDQIYKNAVKVPYFCRFHVYARRRPTAPPLSSSLGAAASSACPSPTTSMISSVSTNVNRALNNPAHVRILCLTEPARALHPLELQEDFIEIARSDYAEVRDKSEIEVNFGGNLYKSHVRGDEDCEEFEYDCGSHKLIFHPFNDNRQGFAVKRRNENNPYGKGSISISSSDITLFEAKIDLSRFMS